MTIHANQAYARRMMEAFGDGNASREHEETRSSQQRRLGSHRRGPSWAENSPRSKRGTGGRRASKRGSVLDNASLFGLSAKPGGGSYLPKKQSDASHYSGLGKSAGRQG